MSTKKALAVEPAKEDLQLSTIKKQAGKMQEMVDSTIVDSEEALAAVADKIKNVKTLGKAVRAEMEKYTKPAQAIINEARAKYLPFEKMCTDAETQLKKKAGAYMDEQEAKRKKEEEKIAARVEAGKLKEETGIRKMEELGEERKSVQTESTQLQRRKVRVAYITNAEMVPDKYWVLDESRVKREALAGVEIPGVEVREETQMAIGR